MTDLPEPDDEARDLTEEELAELTGTSDDDGALEGEGSDG